MTTMNDLPAELLLRILAYLPVQSLCSLRAICRRWEDFFITNQSAIYHRVAVEKGLVRSFGIPFEQAVAKAPYMNVLRNDSPDWYTFCRVKTLYKPAVREQEGRLERAARTRPGSERGVHREEERRDQWAG
ncbi:hypothetical protein FKP32DRAFT_582613 [Trametes sanguinea]|nr:hypothetical protein FKP32DRAFT_582613 [Trametes sanguinea]